MPSIYWLNYPNSETPRLKCQVRSCEGRWQLEIMDTANHKVQMFAWEENAKSALREGEGHIVALCCELGLKLPDKPLKWTQGQESF